MKCLNEVLPKYALTKNGKEIALSEDYLFIDTTCKKALEAAINGDILKITEDGRVIRAVKVEN